MVPLASFPGSHDPTHMGNVFEDVTKILWKDDISREAHFPPGGLPYPWYSSSRSNDQVRVEGELTFSNQDRTSPSYSNLGIGFFRKGAVNGDADDFLIEAEAEEDLGDIGSQGDNPFGREGKGYFPFHFIYQCSLRLNKK